MKKALSFILDYSQSFNLDIALLKIEAGAVKLYSLPLFCVKIKIR